MRGTIGLLATLAPLAIVTAIMYFVLDWKPRHQGIKALVRIENLFWAGVLVAFVLVLGYAMLNTHGK